MEETIVEGGDDVGVVFGVPEGEVGGVGELGGEVGYFGGEVEVGVGLEDAVAPGAHGLVRWGGLIDERIKGTYEERGGVGICVRWVRVDF